MAGGAAGRKKKRPSPLAVKPMPTRVNDEKLMGMEIGGSADEQQLPNTSVIKVKPPSDGGNENKMEGAYVKQDHLPSPEPETYSGVKLLKKVDIDLRKVKKEDITFAWNQNRDAHVLEIKKHVEEKSKVKSRSEWTIPRVPEPSPPEDGSKKKRKQACALIEKVEASPPMVYWAETPINYPVADSKYLSHMPFTGDDDNKNKKKKKDQFEEQLVQIYDGKLHTAVDCIKLEEEDVNFDLIKYVHVLMEISATYGDGVFENENTTDGNDQLKRSRKDLKDLTEEDLRAIYERVKSKEDKKLETKKPSLKLLVAIRDAFNTGEEPDEILKRFRYLCTRREFDFACPRNITPANIDASNEHTQVYSKDVQMDSFKSLFCRICFTYSCIKHQALPTREEINCLQKVALLQVDENARTDRKAVSGRKKRATGDVESHTCEFANCWKKNGSDGNLDEHPLVAWERVLSEWNFAERTCFNCHFESYKDYCIVASLIGTKTCRQVMCYHRLSKRIGMSNNAPEAENCEKFPPAASASSFLTPESESSPTPGPSSRCTSARGGANALKHNVWEPEPTNVQDLTTLHPCFHSDGICDSSCTCIINEKRCESSCACLKSCKNRFKGCVCHTTCSTMHCPCFVASRECDPDWCKKCGACELDMKNVTCRNTMVQRGMGKSVYIKKSPVAGLGAFAGEPIKKNEFVVEYTGELISHDESEKRGHVYDERDHTYLFNLNEDLTLDALHMGSVAKFLNSSKRPNCMPVKVNVRGETRLIIRATENIEKDKELFINYQHIVKKTKDKKKGKSKKYVD